MLNAGGSFQLITKMYDRELFKSRILARPDVSCRSMPRVVIAAVAALLAGGHMLAQTITAPGVHPISGRRFANVMGWQGAEWLERSERDIEEEPDKALDALEPLAGLQ